MPETSSSSNIKPSLDKVSDIINSVEIKTQPFTGNIKGYTKITIRTNKPTNINTKTIVNNSKQAVKPSNKQDMVAQLLAKTSAKQNETIAQKQPVVKPVPKVEAPKPVEKPVQKAEIPKQNVKPFQRAEDPDIVIYPVQKAEAPKQIVKQNKKPETKPNIINKVAEKVSKPTDFVNKPQKKEQTDNLKTAFVPTKMEPNKNQDVKTQQKPLIVKEEVNQPKEISSVEQVSETITEEPKQVEQTKTEQTNVVKVPKTSDNKKSRSLITSLFITGILLLLLLFLKLLNKKDNSIKLQDVISKNLDNDFAEPSKEFIEENTEQEQVNITPFVPPQEVILPIHESFEHKIIDNEDMVDETSINNNIEELQQENADESNLLDELYNSTEPVISLESMNIDNALDNDFNEDITPDEVFGVFDEENSEPAIQNISIDSIVENPITETNAIVENVAEQENKLTENIKTQPVEITSENTNIIENDEINIIDELKENITTINTSEIENEENNITNAEIIENKDNKEPETENDNEIIEESKETEEDENFDIVKDSYNFTPTKNIYLIDFEGVSILMASIKDDFFVLKRFDEIIDKPLIVRQTEKNTKKTTYIVRVGSFRGVVEVTLKNIEMVLEL